MTVTADPWVYVVLGVIAYQIGRMVYLVLDQQLRERREKRILKLVNIKFEDDRKDITIITLDTSDKRAMAKLERELRERFNFEEEEDDHGRPGHVTYQGMSKRSGDR